MANRIPLSTVAALGVILTVGFGGLLASGPSAKVARQSPHASAPLTAQTPSTSPPAFEVASIKRHTSDDGGIRTDGPDAERYIATNVPVKSLIDLAYGVKDLQVGGGPNWVQFERFDIDAKVDDSTAEQLRDLPGDEQQTRKFQMLQTLLADRFKLVVTHETKELPIYKMTVAKGGSKLVEVPPGSATAAQAQSSGGGVPAVPVGTSRMSLHDDGQVTIEAKAETMPQLTDLLTRLSGRVVLDQTGLKGTYDFTLKYAFADESLSSQPAAGVQTTEAEPLPAAMQNQLGLKFELTKAPLDTIVIQHVEEPTPN